MKVTTVHRAWLATFLSTEWFDFAVKALSDPNIRIAREDEDSERISAHTCTAHNADERFYVPVRDERMSHVPLVLRPVTAKKKAVGYVVVLDTGRVSDMEVCRAFLRVYARKAVLKTNTLEALCASLIARQAGEDIRNNFAGKALRKVENREELVLAAGPFLSLSDDVYASIRPSLEMRDEALAEVIDELRALQIMQTSEQPEAF